MAGCSLRVLLTQGAHHTHSDFTGHSKSRGQTCEWGREISLFYKEKTFNSEQY